jgi:hypothetical protein
VNFLSQEPWPLTNAPFKSLFCLNSICDLDYSYVKWVGHVNFDKMSCMTKLQNLAPCKCLMLLQVEYLVLDVDT